MSSTEDELEASDPFLERSIFPDAAAVFVFRPASLSAIKDQAIVVLDTNVLLVPYTISPKTLNEISKTYTALRNAGRLAVPAHVAREFAKNRATKLGELYHQLSSKRSGIKLLQAGRYPLFEGVDEYQKVLDLEKEIDAGLRKYQEALGSLLDRVRTWNWDDPVSLLYSNLFTPEVVVEAAIAEDALRKDFDARCKAKIPPGYKDAGKDVNAAGDLIVWHTVLEVAETRKAPVILVSGDGKPDWWHRSSGQSLYPRYELTDEFRRRSQGQSFYITKFSDFLDLFGAKQDVVEEVRKEEVTVRSATADDYIERRRAADEAEEAVGRWLIAEYPFARIVRDEGLADFVVIHADGSRLGVEVKYFAHTRGAHFIPRIRELGYRAFYETQKAGFAQYLLCIVVPSQDAARELMRWIQRMAARTPPMEFSVGVVVDSRYTEVDRGRTIGE
jgi:hypothetical protein